MENSNHDLGIPMRDGFVFRGDDTVETTEAGETWHR
jgi:hypothetical protein